MSADLLQRATEAVRAAGVGSPGEDDAVAARTRAKVLLAVQRQRRGWKRLARGVYLIAAVMVAGTAWAAAESAHVRWSALWGDVEDTPPMRAVAVMTPAPKRARAPQPLLPAVPEVDVQSLPRSGVDVESLPRAIATPTATPTATATATATTPTPTPTPTATPKTSEALYEAAYRSHFIDHDPTDALEGWDAYLEADPDGPLAPEAQYNRAICLVRLGRKADARAALVPFAEGRYGSYRKVDARALIDAIDAPPTCPRKKR